MSKPKRDRGILVGFAWFDHAQLHSLTEVADDRDQLDETYEQWERNALDAVRTLESKGQRIEIVYVDVDAFVAWCKRKRLPSDSDSRAQYVAFLLRQRDRPAKV